MKKLYILTIIILSNIIHGQNSYSIEDNNILKEDTTQELNSNKKHQNFHNSAIIGSNIVFKDQRKYNDISLFIVSRPINENSGKILSVNPNKAELFGSYIKGIDSLKLENTNKASIYTYIESVPFGKEIHENGFFSFSEKNKYYEVLSFDGAISNDKRRIIESYLAMKYGITLSTDYINSEKDTVWDYKQNVGFRKNIICVGRDDNTGLNQKQSISNDAIIAFGVGNHFNHLNFKNSKELHNHDFIFISDNGQSNIDKNNESNSFNRLWKGLLSSKDLKMAKYSFQIDYKRLFRENIKDNHVWMVINKVGNDDDIDFYDAKYIQATNVNANMAIFSDVDLSKYKKGFYFTFLMKPKLFARMRYVSRNCDIQDLEVIAKGANNRHFTYDLLNNITSEMRHLKSDNGVVFENINSGKYSLRVTDLEGNTYEKQFIYKKESNIDLISTPNILEFSNKHELNINASDYLPEDIKNSWWEFKTKKFHIKEMAIESKGTYVLKYINSIGCIKRIEFIAKSSADMLQSQETFGIYPNPVKILEPVTLKVSLNTLSDIKIRIYASSGQILHSEDFTNKAYLEFKYRFPAVGEYIISIETDKIKKSFKTLVN